MRMDQERAMEATRASLAALLIVLPVWSFGGTGKFMSSWVSLLAALLLALDLPWRRPKSLFREYCGGAPRIVALISIGVFAAGYALVAFINARGAFQESTWALAQRESVAWAPSSWNIYGTEKVFYRIVSLTLLFAAFWRYLSKEILAAPVPAEGKGPRRFRLALVVWVLVGSALAVTVVGVLMRLDEAQGLLWFETSNWGGPQSWFGPFVYRGAAAQTLNMAWPFAFAFWLYGGKLDAQTSRFSDPTYFCMGIVVFLGVWYTGSRGALAVSILMATFVGYWLMNRYRRRRDDAVDRFRWRLGVSLLGAALVVSVVQFGNVLTERIASGPESMLGRFAHWRDAWEIFLDYPVFGIGPGAYDAVSVAYNGPYGANGIWVRNVHSDPLQALVCFGLVGTVAMASLFAYWLLATRKDSRRARIDTLAFLTLVAWGGLAVNSFFDLPLQTFGVACHFTVVSALAAVALSRRSLM